VSVNKTRSVFGEDTNWGYHQSHTRIGFQSNGFYESNRLGRTVTMVLFRTIRWSSRFIGMQQGVMRPVTNFTILRTSANVSRMLRSETVETQLLFLHKYPTLLHRFSFKALALPQLMISRAIWANKGWLGRKGCGRRLHRENLGTLRSILLF